MGSVIELRRRAPTAAEAPKPRVDAAARAAATARAEAASVRILIWTFGATAITMCVIATVMLARTWDELWWAVGFLLVFTLAKIALANGLFYIMVNCDTDRRAEPIPRAVGVPIKLREAVRKQTRRARRPTPVSAVAAKHTVPVPRA